MMQARIKFLKLQLQNSLFVLGIVFLLSCSSVVHADQKVGKFSVIVTDDFEHDTAIYKYFVTDDQTKITYEIKLSKGKPVCKPGSRIQVTGKIENSNLLVEDVSKIKCDSP